MIPENIMKQIRKGEGERTEFKTSAQAQDAIGKAVCSFLNSSGGTVFCGVDDKGKIVGIDDAEEQLLKLHIFLQQQITPTAFLTVNRDEEDGKTILSIDVPEGKDRPYVFNGAIYVRQKSQTRTADAETMRRMIETKSITAERWERRPSTAMEDEDLSRDEIRRATSDIKNSGRFTFSDENSDLAILRDLSLMSGGAYTQAADILFATNPARRHPQARVRLTCYSSDKSADAYVDDKTLQGPLVDVLQATLDFIERNTKSSARFSTDNLQREDRPEYPREALREGVVNAVAHRDYSGFSGGVTVSIYPNRIEIWNSGRLPEGLTPGALRKNHPSMPNNPDIAHVLYLRGYMERVGRGTQKIINVCKEYGLSPKWHDKTTGVTLVLKSGGGAEVGEFVLNARQQRLLDALAPDDSINSVEYLERYASEISDRQSRRDLEALELHGYLQRSGKGMKSRYKRTVRT